MGGLERAPARPDDDFHAIDCGAFRRHLQAADDHAQPGNVLQHAARVAEEMVVVVGVVVLIVFAARGWKA